jgi:DNA-binding NarL/FixJ family response regulator
VVDEDRHTADTNVVLLQMWGHEAEAAYSAEDAISKAAALDPDVILLDLGRAIVAGLNLANELRRHCPEAKLVAMTGFTEADIVRRTRNAELDKVLLKPSPARRIKEAVDAECAASSEA